MADAIGGEITGNDREENGPTMEREQDRGGGRW